ncbi:MAG: hypothetical protein IJB36_01720, partial [Clostridia bacterium]|nr:hypothetical protein [Clostridia bacterium]
PPQSGIFRRFLPRSCSQGASITSPDRNKNPSKSPRFAVGDFEKSRFLFSRGKNVANTVCIREYFNKG